MAEAKPESELPRTVEEFDRWHAQQPERWEFVAGLAMRAVPVPLRHALIKGNVYWLLYNALDHKGYRTLISGPEVRSVNLAAIPDIVVARRPLDQRAPALRSPVAIVEVESPERGNCIALKWRQYRLIPNLQRFITIADREREATLHTRVDCWQWQEDVVREGAIELTALGASLPLEAIYDGTDAPAAGDPSARVGLDHDHA